AVFIIAATVLLFFTVPVVVHELSSFIESMPAYVKRLHALASDPSHPWLSKMIGEGLSQAEISLGELTTLASSWFGTFFRSVWSGGRALTSFPSLRVVAPIVACYLLYDWQRMLAAIDKWVPPARRPTVRALAREVDDTIGGFVRGQTVLCLVLAFYYACALWLIGLKHGPVIGFVAGVGGVLPLLCAFFRLGSFLFLPPFALFSPPTPLLLLFAPFFSLPPS